MTVSVPLIDPVAAVIERLNITATWTQDPPGTPTAGYDPDMRTPYPFATPVTGVPDDTRQYLAAIRVPCQVEVRTWEELNQVFSGDAPDSDIVLVTHHFDLTLLSLLDAQGRCALKKGDKITAFERKGIPGSVVKPIDQPLYVYQVMPRSWGFGSFGHDLEIIYTSLRPDTPTG